MKLFKILPAALALVALSSCNSDEFFGQENKVEGQKTMIVKIAEPETDEDITRSSFYSNNSRIFNTNDKLRAYDAQLQKFDVYTYQVDDKFTTSDENVPGTPSYMLFPANMVNYGSWKNSTGMFALMKLAVDKEGVLTYNEETRTVGEDEVTAYLSNIPEFGKVTALEDGALEAQAVYLTGMLKIKIENGASNVLAIRVSSRDANGNANTAMPLWGYFDAVLDAENPLTATANKSMLVKSTEKLVPAVDAKNATLIVDLPKDNMKDYASYVYIPIIPTTSKAENSTDVTYPKLKVEYFDTTGDKNAKYPSSADADNGTWKELTTFENKQIKSNTVYTKDKDGNAMVIGGYTLEVEAANLKDINEAIAKYSKLSGSKKLVINLSADLEVPSADNNAYVDDAKKIVLPKLNDDMTIQIKDHSLKGSDLVIADKAGITAGEGKFTLELLTADKACTKVIVNTAHDVELKTSGNENTKFADVEMNNTASTLTLNGNFTSIPTEFKSDKMEALVIAKDPNTAIVTSVPVTIKDAITNESGVVVKGGASVTVDANAKTINLIDVKAAATTKVGDAADVLVKAGTVTKLKLNKAVTKLQMTGGTIGTLWGDKDDAGKFEPTANLLIATSGASAINTVGAYTAGTDAKQLQFTSTWANGDKVITEISDADVNIYTAAQLAGIAKNSSYTSGKKFILKTDITLAYDAVWTSLTQSEVPFEGGNKTITGLTAALFESLDADVSDLTLANAAITPNAKLLTGFGVLANAVASGKTTTVSNVVVSNATLGNIVGIAGSKSANYGLLIGKSVGTTTITDCGVSGTVNGYYNLGGYVGNLAGGVLTISKTEDNLAKNMSNVTFNKTFTTSEEEDDNAGKIGNFIGSISGEATFVIGDAENAKAFSNFFSANHVTAANIANAVKIGTKSYVGMANKEIGLSTAIITFGGEASKSKLYGKWQNADETPKTYVLGPTAGENQVVMVNIYK